VKEILLSATSINRAAIIYHISFFVLRFVRFSCESSDMDLFHIYSQFYSGSLTV